MSIPITYRSTPISNYLASEKGLSGQKIKHIFKSSFIEKEYIRLQKIREVTGEKKAPDAATKARELINKMELFKMNCRKSPNFGLSSSRVVRNEAREKPQLKRKNIGAASIGEKLQIRLADLEASRTKGVPRRSGIDMIERFLGKNGDQIMNQFNKSARNIYHNLQSMNSSSLHVIQNVPLLNPENAIKIKKARDIVERAKSTSRRLDEMQQTFLSTIRKERRNSLTIFPVEFSLPKEINPLVIDYTNAKPIHSGSISATLLPKRRIFHRKAISQFTDTCISEKKAENTKVVQSVSAKRDFYKSKTGSRSQKQIYSKRLGEFSSSLSKLIRSKEDADYIKSMESLKSELYKRHKNPERVTLNGIFKKYFTKPEDPEVMKVSNQIYISANSRTKNKIFRSSMGLSKRTVGRFRANKAFAIFDYIE